MRIVMVISVFIVYCDVCDNMCCCLLFSVNRLRCLCSLCLASTFSFEGINNFLADLTD